MSIGNHQENLQMQYRILCSTFLHVTKLILWKTHENLCHSGHNHVLSTCGPSISGAMSVEAQMEQQDNNRQQKLPCQKVYFTLSLALLWSVQSKTWKKYTEKVKCYFYCYFYPCSTLRGIVLTGHGLLSQCSMLLHALRGQLKVLHSNNWWTFVGAEPDLERATEEGNFSKIDNTVSVASSGSIILSQAPTTEVSGRGWSSP